MIEVYKSPNADSRSADPSAPIAELKSSTESHISDVAKGLEFISDLLKERGQQHDHTKIEHMEDFNAAIKGGKIKETEWYRLHTTEERHHLKTHIPEDVNLIDALEHLVDCTMAGLTRSGQIYDTDIPQEVLLVAAQNTVELLKKNIRVVDAEIPIGDQPIQDPD